MSVLSYLTDLSNNLKIQDQERNNIDRSINNLSSKIDYRMINVQRKFVFGSYDRKTILKRYYDLNSDVDYMIVFSDGHIYSPQTMMNRIRSFAQSNYSRSEIYQSSPTIVLELNHIKFELIPAYESWGTLYIPAPSSDFNKWTPTNPQGIKNTLNLKNQSNNYLIRKLVRLLKYWNVKNGKIYSSFELENFIINNNYWFCTNLKEYLYQAVENLPIYSLPFYKQQKVSRLKDVISKVKELDRTGYVFTAEENIKKEF